MDERYRPLLLDSQLCFPLYACSKEIVRRYKPFLDKLDLTYTQYITMMVLWEKKEASVKELGKLLLLDSGTLTPVLKKLEKKGYVERERKSDDERSVLISITGKGLDLRDQALSIPQRMRSCMEVEDDDFKTLYRILHQLMDGFQQNSSW